MTKRFALESVFRPPRPSVQRIPEQWFLMFVFAIPTCFPLPSLPPAERSKSCCPPSRTKAVGQKKNRKTSNVSSDFPDLGRQGRRPLTVSGKFPRGQRTPIRQSINSAALLAFKVVFPYDWGSVSLRPTGILLDFIPEQPRQVRGRLRRMPALYVRDCDGQRAGRRHGRGT